VDLYDRPKDDFLVDTAGDTNESDENEDEEEVKAPAAEKRCSKLGKLIRLSLSIRMEAADTLS